MADDASNDMIEERRAWVDQRQVVDGDSRLTNTGSAGQSPRSRRRVLSAHGEAWSDRQPASRALHRLGEVTSRATAGVVAAIAVAGWGVVGILTGFPRWWESVLYATGTSVTLMMVFAIQHTQARQEKAIQRKLDELLRALPSADNRLIAAEDAPDEELDALAELNLADRDGHAPP